MKKATAIAVVALSVMPSFAAKKLIFIGWDTGDLTPAEIVRNAEALYEAGADGVGIYPRLKEGKGPTKQASAINCGRVLAEADFEWMIPSLREMSAKPGLSESMFRSGMSPKKRVDWRDDGFWAQLATNLSVVARVAKRGGLKGVITDFEDYWHQGQYFIAKDDPSFDETCTLARRRGAETFGAMFRAFPEMTWLTYQFFSHEGCYRRAPDPVELMRERGDLYPAFFNGILDAMPSGVKLVDGAELYRLRAENSDFLRQARHEFSGVLPLVAPENRAKYRAQLSISVGQYPDSYAWHVEKSGWYFGPVNGSRLAHFERNLAGALESCDEYVWLWGEHRMFVNWKDLDQRHWWDEWWGGEASLDDALPGYADVLWGLKSPAKYVERRFAKGNVEDVLSKACEWEWQGGGEKDKKGAISLEDVKGRGTCRVFSGPMKDGSVNFTLKGVKPGEWYGATVALKGFGGRLGAGWQKDGKWRYDKPGATAEWSAPDAHGWRRGFVLARVPDDVNALNVGIGARLKDEGKVFFAGIRIAKLRDVPDGAKELRQIPKHKKKTN